MMGYYVTQFILLSSTTFFNLGNWKLKLKIQKKSHHGIRILESLKNHKIIVGQG